MSRFDFKSNRSLIYCGILPHSFLFYPTSLRINVPVAEELIKSAWPLLNVLLTIYSGF